MTVNELRKAYIDFFVSKGHKSIPSASLVPENDPTILFTPAGMSPLVPYLMGEEHPAGKRLVNSQKCVRTIDIDEVGDDTHLTFFEMLGNWSLGDYFKEESIEYSFEFLTKTLGIPVSKLGVSYFEGDDDAPVDETSRDKWIELGVPEGRVVAFDKKDNWWPAGSNSVGPQGPDTEIFYWKGEGDAPDKMVINDDEWVEIWNNVFMEYNRKKEGDKLEPLAQKNVDTGMGLERTAAVLQGFSNVYETEAFTPILEAIEKVTGRSYNESDEVTRSMRIVADHVRTAVMMVADGVLPSNKDRGYILRRIIRRAVREMNKLGGDELESTAKVAIDTMSEAYEPDADKILAELKKEVTAFSKTLAKGLKEFDKKFKKNLDGETAFLLYQSYGFPIEMTEELAAERGGSVDLKGFEAELKKHQDSSRLASEAKFKGGLADDSDESKKLHTATHLLHQALRTVLGDHVEQRGSNITPERLRFDFTHDKKVSKDELKEVEELVNKAIDDNLEVSKASMTLDEAKKSGAIGIFDEKYGDEVTVYEVKGFSKEICGGPHVTNTSEIGRFAIKKEEASSAGIRRIKAVIGEKAEELLKNR